MTLPAENSKQVLVHLAKGESNSEIAAALGIAEQTVRNYVASIYSKINVNSRAMVPRPVSGR